MTRQGIRELIAVAWYELDPAVIDGVELPFDEAPIAHLKRAYSHADDVLAMLTADAA